MSESDIETFVDNYMQVVGKKINNLPTENEMVHVDYVCDMAGEMVSDFAKHLRETQEPEPPKE